jgi:hypothetical protein
VAGGWNDMWYDRQKSDGSHTDGNNKEDIASGIVNFI